MAEKIISLELNEINFEYIQDYINQGKLPNFKYLFENFGYTRTSSEKCYQELEPWIQWVTAHTGLSYEEHKVFRLGDIEKSNVKQIWELLEEKGISVAAVSPINASNKTTKAKFFIPDPWTKSKVSGSTSLKWVYDAIAQVVNDNAKQKITFSSVLGLLLGASLNTRYSSIPAYIRYLNSHRKGNAWARALFLDRLLTDLFLTQWKKHKPQFSSLFLNAGAHIQHHYLFSSPAYKGKIKNPAWYIKPGRDPVLEAYELYDKIVEEVLKEAKINNVRVILATGLQQIPHHEFVIYYRLKEHEKFLRKIGISPAKVVPRMSRDFHVEFNSDAEAIHAENILLSVTDTSGEKLFSVDLRADNSLFVMLEYSKEIANGFMAYLNGKPLSAFSDEVAFVAIKNGKHDEIGYYSDTKEHFTQPNSVMPLKDVFSRVVEAF